MTFFLLKFPSGLVLSFICYLDSFDRALMKVEPFPLLFLLLLSLATLLALMFRDERPRSVCNDFIFPSFIPFQYLLSFCYLLATAELGQNSFITPGLRIRQTELRVETDFGHGIVSFDIRFLVYVRLCTYQLDNLSPFTSGSLPLFDLRKVQHP